MEETGMNIDWHSKDSHVFINPRLSHFINLNLNQIIDEFFLQSHILLATSGSTAYSPTEIKFVALKKSAILFSSDSVNEHLLCNGKDVILNSLPYFHIGGLSTYSRAYLSGAKLVNIYSEKLKWDPSYFVKEAELNNATITSLVPTQIFDIINANLKSPKTLRAVVVGGGALSRSLYEKALKLGWQLLPSYGMTECCSQVATASFDFKWDSPFPDLKILKHLNVKTNSEGKICINGNSLLTGYILVDNGKYKFMDIKTDFIEDLNDTSKYITTSDLGSVKGNNLNIYGRKDDVVKIGGESVSLSRLDGILVDIKSELNISDDIVVVSESDKRLENKISLVLLKDNKNNEYLKNIIISEFNKRVFPFERIKNLYFVESIPRTDLGKLKRSQLLNDLDKND
jgi:o-succinylbenzoate---CoA ligase